MEVIIIKERIRQLRKQLHLSQEEFGRRLQLSRNFIYMVENGQRELSNRTIDDICNCFNVNRNWLVNGIGEMYVPSEEDDRLGTFIGEALSGQIADDVRLYLLRTLSQLEPDDWEVLYKVARLWVDQKENGGQT